MATDPKSSKLSYRDAGVDIDAGGELVDRIGPAAERTRRPEVLGGLGGFGSLFRVPIERYREPVLVSGTDGVGTKLRLAIELDRHDTIGIDLVAMCANDIVVSGVDYFATGRLNVAQGAAIVEGIAKGCELSGMSLVGGETAEMPGMYAPGDYDLAGFAVGIVERARIIDGQAVRVGDAIIALASSGAHSNGYSLVRKVVERSGVALDSPFESSTLGAALLAPTRIYVRAVRALAEVVPVHALAHITGGGIVENLPRVLPDGVRARIDSSSWQRPAVFDWLQHNGNIDDAEMWRTFNCGVGMLVVVPADAVTKALAVLDRHGETAWVAGAIEPGDGPAHVHLA